MLSRRDFLSRSALVALAPTVPTFLARSVRAATPQRDGRVPTIPGLGEDPGALGLRHRRVGGVLEADNAAATDALGAGDEIAILPPMAGG